MSSYELQVIGDRDYNTEHKETPISDQLPLRIQLSPQTKCKWFTKFRQNKALQNKENRDTLFTVLITFVTTLWTFLLIVIPVVAQVPAFNYYNSHDNWFTGNDIMRLIEPLSFIVYFYIFYLEYVKHPHLLILFGFLFGCFLYIQGSALHSASNMFKDALETLPNNGTTYNDLYYWFETVWEHGVGHYMYGTGLAIIIGLTELVHRFEVQVTSIKTIRFIVIITFIIRSLLIAGACIEFPSGTIVGLVYLISSCIVRLFYIIRYVPEKLKLFILIEKRPMLMSFTYSYCWALFILIIWICVHGFNSRNQTNV